MSFATLVVLILVAVVVVAIAQVVLTSGRQKAMNEHLVSVQDFASTQKVMASDGHAGIAIDEPRQKVCLIRHGPQGATNRIFGYGDLISCEIFQDGVTVTKTVRSSQIGGALVGGLMLGGVGAIIGGLSGKTQTTDKVKKVDLRIIVNDTKAPIHDVNFMNFEGKTGGYSHKAAMSQARHWQGLLEVLIKRADMEDRMQESVQAKRSTGSLADELRKLADLRDSGILDATEFQKEKARLLA